ncbi:hypothetical protein ACTA71_005444 [Dictyostelium dimigraforme]
MVIIIIIIPYQQKTTNRSSIVNNLPSVSDRFDSYKGKSSVLVLSKHFQKTNYRYHDKILSLDSHISNHSIWQMVMVLKGEVIILYITGIIRILYLAVGMTDPLPDTKEIHLINGLIIKMNVQQQVTFACSLVTHSSKIVVLCSISFNQLHSYMPVSTDSLKCFIQQKINKPTCPSKTGLSVTKVGNSRKRKINNYFQRDRMVWETILSTSKLNSGIQSGQENLNTISITERTLTLTAIRK